MVDFDSDAKRSFASRLGQSRVTCRECGFDDTVLDGAWRTRAGSSDGSRLSYTLRCPDCNATRELPLTL